jgi:hypothetical protein
VVAVEQEDQAQVILLMAVVLDILGLLQEIRMPAAAIGVVIQCLDQAVVVVAQLAAAQVQ